MSEQDAFVSHQQTLHQQQSALLAKMDSYLTNPTFEPQQLLGTLRNMLSVMNTRSESLSSHYEQASRLTSISDAVTIVQAQNQEALSQQTVMLNTMQSMVHQMLEKPAAPVAPESHHHRRVHIPHPFTPAFNGDPKTLSFRAFKAKLGVVFQRFDSAFQNDNQCVNYALSCMTGPPLEHYAPIFNREVDDEEDILENYNNFISAVEAAYGDRLSVQEAEDKIRFLKQRGSMQEYISEFSTLQGQVRYNQAALVSQFKFGLSDPVRVLLQNQWHSLQTMKDATEAATTAYQNHRLANRRPVVHRPVAQPWQHKPNPHPTRNPPAPAPASSGPTAMELGAIRGPLSSHEKERRRRDRLCMYCGTGGHFAAQCPNKRPPNASLNMVHEATVNFDFSSDLGNESA
jgi:hypothetical protein